MAKYAEGQEYLRNKVTGAVFQHNPNIAGLADLELVVGNAEGGLDKVLTRGQADAQLAPTKTPEKTSKSNTSDGKKEVVSSKPTMTPLDDKAL